MAKIILVNFEEPLRQRLSGLLRNERHEVFPSSSGESWSQAIQQNDINADLVIVDVSQHVRHAYTLLAEICSHRTKHGPQPMVLCISRVYRGPQFERDLERKGARLLYV